MLHNAPKSPPGKASSEVWMEGFVTLALFVTEKENELEITVKKKNLLFFNILFKDTLGKPPAKEIPLVDHCKYK